MGVVYKAIDTKLDRTVALKFLAPHLLRNDDARRCYLLAIVTFALGTLAKPTIIVLPLLLLLEMLREPRRVGRPQVLWLIPFVIIAIAVYWLNSLVGAGGRMSLFQAVYLPAIFNDWLLRVGLVATRRDGQHVFYRL